MATMNSLYRYMYDAAPAIALRSKDAAPVTMTSAGDALILDKVLGHWNKPSPLLADHTFAVVVNVDEVARSEPYLFLNFEIDLAAVAENDEIYLNDETNDYTLVAGVDFDLEDAAADLFAVIADLELDFDVATNGNLVTISGATGTQVEGTGGIVVTSDSELVEPNETYALALQFGPTGFATSITTHNLPVTKPGQYVFLVDAPTIAAMQAGTDAVRIATTVAGAAPSIKFHAWFAGAFLK